MKLKRSALVLLALCLGSAFQSTPAVADDHNFSEVRGRLWKIVEHKLSGGDVWRVDIGVYTQAPGSPVSPIFKCNSAGNCEADAVALIDLFTCNVTIDNESDPLEPGGTMVTHRCPSFDPEGGPCIRVEGWNDSYQGGVGVNALTANGVGVLVDSVSSKFSFCSDWN